MPIINISVTGKPDARLSATIAKEITELTATHLRKDPTITAVAVSYVDPQHWFAGGKSLAEHGATPSGSTSRWSTAPTPSWSWRPI